MSIVHMLQQLHLGSSKLPAQQLVCYVLPQVLLVHRLGNDCTILVETPSQQYLNQSWNPQPWVMCLQLLEKAPAAVCCSSLLLFFSSKTAEYVLLAVPLIFAAC